MALPAPTNTGVLPATSPLVARIRTTFAPFEALTRQPAIRRALPSIVIIGASGLAIGLWLMLRAPDTTPVFPGMAEADKSQVMQVLTTAGITASIDTATGNIVVATGDYQKAKMTLAAQGLPASAPDATTVLDSLPMGESRSVEAVRLRQAQELDLARSIAQISGVQGANVHLALPEPSAFVRDNQPPRASVFLQLAGGRVLDAMQVQAIVNLVSSAVPGMAQQDVTVVDQRGQLLSQASDDPAALQGDQEMSRRLSMEKVYRDRVLELLSPIVGPENISVQVTMDVDFSRKQLTEEKVDPNGSAILSEQTQSTENVSAPARGIPGGISNTPPATPQVAGAATPPAGAAAAAAGTNPTAAANGAPAVTGGDNSNKSSNTTRNYQVSRSVQTTEPASSEIRRISAAIVVRAPAVDPAAAKGKPVDPNAPLIPAAQLADLENLAKTAIGFDANRGDTVTVLAKPFADAITSTVPPASSMDWLPEVLRQVGLIVGIAIIGLGIIRPLLSRLMTGAEAPRGQTEDPGLGPVEVAEGESLDLVQAKLDQRNKKLVEAALGAGSSREEKFAALRQLAAEDPGRIATVLQRMMKPELSQNS